MYYISKRFTGVEKNYPKLEKLAHFLLIASRKLWPYFKAHPIKGLTDLLLKQMLYQPETSRRLLKWNIELNQYDITYHPRKAINGQALANFIVEFTMRDDEEEVQSETYMQWKLFVDGASNNFCLGAGVVLENLEGRAISYALRLEFLAINNEAEYEALIVGLKVVKELKINAIHIYIGSQRSFVRWKGSIRHVVRILPYSCPKYRNCWSTSCTTPSLTSHGSKH